MKRFLSIIMLLILTMILVACVENTDLPPVVDNDYPDSNLSIEEKVAWWLENLTLAEKAGQMVQGERSNNGGQSGVTPTKVKELNLGSVLNGGGNVPSVNNPTNWYQMYQTMYNASLASSSKIPIIYGVDAVHGHGNLYGATIFPHNIGLAAANNPELMEDIGEVVSYEIAQTGLTYNFSPSIGLIKDKRWGRVYETLGENPVVAKNLIGPYIEGLQLFDIAASAKHFIADGYTEFGTGLDGKVDRGNAELTIEELEEHHFPLYEAAISAGVKTIMVSYSSLNGVKMHENRELVTEILKGEMNFEGFVIGDYNGIDDIDASTLMLKVAHAINAGVDMLMQPHNFEQIIDLIILNVNNHRIPMSRIDDAVGRIIKVKYEMGLFEEKERKATDLRNENSLNIARQAVRESLVLLKNNENVLPLNKNMDLLIIGEGSDNIGIQSGGWTINWQGGDQINIPGTTILDAFKEVSTGNIYTDMNDLPLADAIVLVVSEKPHAEMMGDSVALSLISDTGYQSNLMHIQNAINKGIPVITLMLASKPLIIEDYIDDFDAFVMLFLPGTEGLGITDVLYGDYDFKGKLPYTWPKFVDQASETMLKSSYNPSDYRFAYGSGLTYAS